jgi:threonine synthase
MSDNSFRLRCFRCGTVYGADDPRWRCDCGSLLDLEVERHFRPEAVETRKATMWRYREALPVGDDRNIVSFDEGYTPLLKTDFAGRPVLVKQDHLFPSGSFKDRGASVLISKIKELDVAHVVEDSSGNAGSAIAAYCARAGIGCTVFVPDDSPSGKLAQIERYGAELVRVSGDRQDAADRAFEAAASSYYASHSWNPFFIHGTKTFAFEVCEQLKWHSPDTIILPVGNGTLLLGAYVGFKELQAAGIITELPKLIGVQAARCAPLHNAFKFGLTEIPELEWTHTVADGIAVNAPIRGAQVLEAVRATYGNVLAVEEHEIRAALKTSWAEGYYIEPTAAAAVAGVLRYLPDADPDEVIVTAFTGHGLKTARDWQRRD